MKARAKISAVSLHPSQTNMPDPGGGHQVFSEDMSVDHPSAVLEAVNTTVRSMIGVMEMLENADFNEILGQFRRNLREDETKHRESERQRMRVKLEIMFRRLDEDGSGSLSFVEVLRGLEEIGLQHVSEGRLKEMFDSVCSKQDDTISLNGLDFLLRTLTCAVAPTDMHFAIEVDVYLKALDATAIPITNGDRTKCAAAQKLCALCKHGDEEEARKRQLFIVQMGGIRILLRCLHTLEPDLQFWSVFAVNKVSTEQDPHVLASISLCVCTCVHVEMFTHCSLLCFKIWIHVQTHIVIKAHMPVLFENSCGRCMYLHGFSDAHVCMYICVYVK